MTRNLASYLWVGWYHTNRHWYSKAARKVQLSHCSSGFIRFCPRTILSAGSLLCILSRTFGDQCCLSTCCLKKRWSLIVKHMLCLWFNCQPLWLLQSNCLLDWYFVSPDLRQLSVWCLHFTKSKLYRICFCVICIFYFKWMKHCLMPMS